MYKKVIIPLDMSDFGAQVLPVVREVTAPKRSQLVLVHCIEPQKHAYSGLTDDLDLLEKLVGDLRTPATQYLEAIQGQLQSKGFTVTTRIGQGDAAQYIVDVAAEEEADLIAMTTHGRTGIVRAALGSIADRVMRTTRQPVLLVRSTNTNQVVESKPIRKIMVPFDGSALSEEALDQAKIIAEDSGASIHLLQVLEPMQKWEQMLLYGPDRPFETIADARYSAAETYLEMVRQALENAQHSATAKLYTGIVADSILDAAKNEAVDLVVMGTHGYGGYTRWVYGSVANRVVHEATCPLLMLRCTPTDIDIPALKDISMAVGL